MSQEKLDELLAPMIVSAEQFDPVKSQEAIDGSTDTKFGGCPYAQENDEWPQCPTCNKELNFVAQLNDRTKECLYVFFYCFECFPWGLGDEEKGQWVIRRYLNPSMKKYKTIESSNESEYTVVPCTVSSKTVRVLPDWDGLEAFSKQASDLCSELNDDSPWEEYDSAFLRNNCLNDYATLLGGYPRWVQGEAVNNCSVCNTELKFLAQIDSEEVVGLMWGDVGLVYLFQCPNHPDEFHLELQCH